MTTPRNAKGEVPGLLLGDFLFCSQPGRQNEADARLVLRMAMTGESISDLKTNLKKTYGPLMNLETLMKLMTAKQDYGKTLFYSEFPSTSQDDRQSRASSRRKRRSQTNDPTTSNGQRTARMIIKKTKKFETMNGNIASDLIQGNTVFSMKHYFHTIHRLVGTFQNRKGNNSHQPSLRNFASVSSNKEFFSENKSSSSNENIIESVPLEIALRLLMNSKDKYQLVVQKEDLRRDCKTPVFCIKGVEMSVDTSEGPVTFMPMFFSKKELQKTFSLFRNLLRKMWLASRVQKRNEICNRLITSFSSITGIDGVFSDSRPTVRGSTDDFEEDDGLGNGDPPEIKEFIEEMGEAGADFIPSATPSLMALPLMILFGCLAASTALWKDLALIADLVLMNSPLEPVILGIPKKIHAHPIPLESCIEKLSSYNIHKLSQKKEKEGLTSQEYSKRTLDCLQLLQFLLSGVWQIANFSRRSQSTLTMISNRGPHPVPLPDIKRMRRRAENVNLSTIIEVDPKQFHDPQNSNSQEPVQNPISTLDLKLAFNLKTAFDEVPNNQLPKPINTETVLGICLIGNLGLHSMLLRIPSLGFTDISEISSGIPFNTAESK